MKAAYLKLAEFWIETRGNHEGRRDYRQLRPGPQAGLPAGDARGPCGPRHADVRRPGGAGRDQRPRRVYRQSAGRLWDNMTGRRMHVNGGVGASREGEAFTSDYNLPNDGYLETCAAIGSGFFSRNMNLLCGDARYVDELERTLYNAVPAGVSLQGDSYFYENPLQAGKDRAAGRGTAAPAARRCS